jgi:hypothetical protein
MASFGETQGQWKMPVYWVSRDHFGWVAQLELKALSRISNYGQHHIEELLSPQNGFKHKPVINQIELHPFLGRQKLTEYCQQQKIVVEAYSPLTRGKLLNDDKLVKMAAKHNKTPAQILVRWCVDKGYVVIPKSVKKERILENAGVWNWKLTPEDLEEMATWDADHKIGNSFWSREMTLVHRFPTDLYFFFLSVFVSMGSDCLGMMRDLG